MTKRRRQLVSSEEAVRGKVQHTKPCDDCPFARHAMRGWLGGGTVDEWLTIAHGEAKVECHTLLGAQCTGLAVYRANILKLPRDPSILRLHADRTTCFSSPDEFREHHSRKK